MMVMNWMPCWLKRLQADQDRAEIVLCLRDMNDLVLGGRGITVVILPACHIVVKILRMR
jgi:hypothetical protein